MFVEITKHTVRDFSQWVEYFGEHFLTELAAGYASEYAGSRPATEKTAWYQIQNFLNFISQSGGAKSLKQWLLNHNWKSTPPLDVSVHWYSVIADYRESLKKQDIGNSSRGNAVWGDNRFLEIAENKGLVPLGLRLHGWKVEPEIGQGSTFLDVTIDKSIDLEALVGSGIDFVEDAVELDDQERRASGLSLPILCLKRKIIIRTKILIYFHQQQLFLRDASNLLSALLLKSLSTI